MKNKMPAWVVLTVICVVAAALLAATNLLTKDTIEQNAIRAKYETLSKLMPEAADFEETESGIVIGKNDADSIVGYSKAAVTQGFGGEVETTVAAGPDGTLIGVSVGGANFAETAGLGARAKEPEFQAQFAGKSAPVALTKDGGEIEALSGATITSRAVIKGVNEAMEGIAAEAGFTVESTSTAEHLGDGKYAATAQGFGGPVKVYLTLDDSRTIQEISIGDSQFAETAGLGALALEDQFQSQFIGKTIPVAIGDIDALSGATITTNAVLEAIGEISSGLDHGLADAPVTEEAAPAAEEAAPAEEKQEEAADTTEYQYEGLAQGYVGKVRVFLNLDENHAITAIKIGDEEFEETPGVGAKAQEEEFTSQFIGKTLPMTIKDIDVLTGATYTTEAVMRAIQQISDSLEQGDAAPAEEDKAPAEEEQAPAADTTEYQYEGLAQGYVGKVKVFLNLDENHAITAIKIGDEEFEETPGVGAKAQEEEFTSQFIGKTLPMTIKDIDVLTGATYTTEAVMRAIQQISDGLQ